MSCWKQSCVFGYRRHTWAGDRTIRIAETFYQVRRKAGWGQRARSVKKRFWLVHDITGKQKTIGKTRGYERLKDAKTAAEAYLRSKVGTR